MSILATILWSAITGLTWTAIGIVLNRCASKDFDVAAYSIVQALTAGLLCLLFYTDFRGDFRWQSYVLLVAVIFSAAILNAFAQYLVKYAMERGNPASVWAMAQSAMVFPFLTGTIILGGVSTLWNWIGICILITGIIFPAAGGFGKVRSWFVPALIAMLVYGLFQSLYLIPSHCASMKDPISLRPAMVCFGNFIGWSIVTSVRTKHIRFSKKAVIAALIMAIIHAFGVKTFFFALDGFASIHMEGLAMPFMLGVNLLGFNIYSIVLIKEKRNRSDVISLLFIILGILLLGI